jgi:hypothetical protein
VQLKKDKRDEWYEPHASLLLAPCVVLAQENRVGAAKSNVYNHVAVDKHGAW